jgi:hypothetical protein
MYAEVRFWGLHRAASRHRFVWRIGGCVFRALAKGQMTEKEVP